MERKVSEKTQHALRNILSHFAIPTDILDKIVNGDFPFGVLEPQHLKANQAKKAPRKKGWQTFTFNPDRVVDGISDLTIIVDGHIVEFHLYGGCFSLLLSPDGVRYTLLDGATLTKGDEIEVRLQKLEGVRREDRARDPDLPSFNFNGRMEDFDWFCLSDPKKLSHLSCHHPMMKVHDLALGIPLDYGP